MTATAEGSTPPRPRRDTPFWAVMGVGLAVGLANVAKPVHIDDTLYLAIARHIVAHPLDPYGGTINWQQVPEPAYNVSISPPLLSYQFALAIAVAGERIPLLHATMIPWVLLACWAIYRLGQRWAGAGASTALLVVLGPAVVVGLNLMLDVPLLACLCAAVECLMRGIERRSARWYLAAGVLGAVGVGIKFPALALVPTFLVAALHRRRWGPAMAAIGPVAAMIAWQAASRSLYGASQVEAGLSFLEQFRTSFGRQLLERSLLAGALLAWTFPAWILAPSRLDTRGRIGSAVVAVLATALAAALLGIDGVREHPGPGAAFLGGVGLGAFALVACAIAGRGEVKGADDPGPILWAWILAVLAIVVPFGPFVAVRSLLPIQPALAILLLRGGRRPSRAAVGATIAATALLGIALGATDLRWASCYPTAARQLAERFEGRPVLFSGHWGWQYYAEHQGFTPWDARRTTAPIGTVVVVPLRADPHFIHPSARAQFRPIDRITVPPNPARLTTWDREAGVRFYGGDFGELPWGPSAAPTEEFFVFEVGPPPIAPSRALP